MLNRTHIGKVFPSFKVEVEKGRLRFFAKAIGETDPVYTDECAAQASGYASLPVLPTFLFCLEMEQPDPMGWMSEVGLSLARILHGEQSFVYHAPACAGDVLVFESKIVDMYDKKDGALEFVVKETKVTKEDGTLVAELRGVIVQRNR